ncbi:MAG: hydroxyacid dehydrogenase [Pseudomonadota bacterium]|nr:hydroxyacid dehydrogenase [Pseudomonadota bacterium]
MAPQGSIAISEFMDERAVDALRARFAVRYEPTLVDRRAELLAALGETEALIVRNRTQVDAALLAAAPRLRVVGRLGVGLDNIDSAACAARGIDVIPATGANAQAVAEYVICTAMLLLRGAYGASAEVGEGEWPRTRLSNGRECAGKVLGLIGFGGIGRLTARLAKALGMQLIAHDPALAADAACWSELGVEPLALEALLERADIISLHVPLDAATRHLLDASRLARMKPGAVLINTARGGIVDEAALATALRAGRIAGAALDVFANEPLAAGSPLAGAPNLLLTPHVAGVTVESNERVSSLIAERVAAALAPAAGTAKGFS